MMTLDRFAHYKVNNNRLDDDHYSILTGMDSLIELSKVDSVKALNKLSSLASELAHHFADEEAVLSRKGFPYLDSHRTDHQKLYARFMEINDHFRNDKINPVFIKFAITDFEERFVYHIDNFDRQYIAIVAAA